MVLFLQKVIFQPLRKNCLNLHIVFGILSLQKAYYFVEICFYCNCFINKLPCFFISWWHFSNCLVFFQVNEIFKNVTMRHLISVEKKWIYYLLVNNTELSIWEIPINSGATRGLTQGEILAEKGPLPTVRGPLANTQKKFENRWWSRMRMATLKS